MKKVLLIGGGGTLGTYTASELLKLGHKVDIICLEDNVSDNDNLKYYKALATLEYLYGFFKDNYYDGIVNFLHYNEVERYEPYHKLLSSSTDHLIFLSSYRVYSDLEHPITENSPFLLDVIKDNEFLENEKYALSKAKCENFLRNNPYKKNWTIARPVISFSDKRLDLILRTGHEIINAAKNNETLTLPVEAKNLTAGLDWAGNSGKLIANLLFKKECVTEAYTVSSAQNLTWSEVADIYTKLLHINFKWVNADYPHNTWHWYYDRAYDRKIDNSKILKATGLKSDDFKSILFFIESLSV